MSDAFVQVNPDNASGKKIRTTEIDVGANTVEQQVVELADEAGNKLAPVLGTLIDGDTQGAPLVQGLVADASPQIYVDGEARPLSLTNDGRLRVASVPARQGVPFFHQDQENQWGSLASPRMQPGSPWGDW